MDYVNNNNSLKEAALEYAANGISVFPLEPGSMDPLEDGGPYTATTDRQLIERWWTEHPDCNIGHPVGDDMLVIDLKADPMFRHRDGIEMLAEYESTYGPLPPTASCGNESGDIMLFYKGCLLFDVRMDAYPGIDILDYKNYIVLPPSITYQGEFKWQEQSILDGVAYVDDAVVDFIAAAAWKLRPSSDLYREYLELSDIPEYLLVPKWYRDLFLLGHIDNMYDLGYSATAIKEIVRDLNQYHCDPPYTKDELRNEVFERRDPCE